MSKVKELHDKAMELAHLALIARHQDNPAKAEALARDACQYETQAAHLVLKEPAAEPTRSILYRGAASLAYQSKDFVKAQELIAEGFAGFPPPWVAQELRDLAEQINELLNPLQSLPDELASDSDFLPVPPNKTYYSPTARDSFGAAEMLLEESRR